MLVGGGEGKRREGWTGTALCRDDHVGGVRARERYQVVEKLEGRGWFSSASER